MQMMEMTEQMTGYLQSFLGNTGFGNFGPVFNGSPGFNAPGFIPPGAPINSFNSFNGFNSFPAPTAVTPPASNPLPFISSPPPQNPLPTTGIPTTTNVLPINTVTPASIIIAPVSTTATSSVPTGPVTIVPGTDPGVAAIPMLEQQNITGANTAPLQSLINQLATDPVGRLELALAKKNGVQIQYTSTGDPNILGDYQPSTNTITINPSGTTQLKTLAHELVHAATPSDGDSILEEGIANIVGTQVAARIQGTVAPDPNQVLQQTIPIYQNAGLPNDNTIVQDLAALRIIVPNLTV